MSSNPIIIASVLKPVGDPRMFHKLGQSVCKLTGFSVKIIGFDGKIPPSNQIKGVPLFDIHPKSYISRMLSGWKYFLYAFRQHPEIQIICTHELVIPAVFIKAIFGGRIVYDFQDNYLLNLTYSKYHSKWAQWIGKSIIAFRFWWVRHTFDYVLFAEKIYTQQFKLKNTPFSILENKSVIQNNSLKRENRVLLFSGTVATQTGIFECIQLYQTLAKDHPEWKLVICGYCTNELEREKIKSIISPFKNISWIGVNKLVSYEEVALQIQKCSCAFINYEFSPAVEGKVPTKIFEYISTNTPILIFKPFHEWNDLLQHYPRWLEVRSCTQISTSQVDELITNTPSSPLNSEVNWQLQFENSDFSMWLKSVLN